MTIAMKNSGEGSVSINNESVQEATAAGNNVIYFNILVLKNL